ncbi:MAG: phytoene/squalene synthase family protein [Bacteroidales bacterium]
MKSLYDKVSYDLSKSLTKSYSTSFSLGIRFLGKELRNPIYAIYGFVRLADEIVDTFHDYDKEKLFQRFKENLDMALEDRISVNPLLNSFQEVVHKYNIERELIDAFLHSMEMDLNKKDYTRQDFDEYVLGSAEVVGLMCLHVFVNGDEEEYRRLKPMGMKLGAAYQKINFLRDLAADFDNMGRTYFPGVDLTNFNEEDKAIIEEEIDEDFMEGLAGIKQLPASSKLGVYLSFVYYYKLFQKIRGLPAKEVRKKRIRISDLRKYGLLLNTYLKFRLNMI